MSGMDLPVKAIREQISSAFDLIVHQSRMRDGSRKITYITEVQSLEGNVITLQNLYRFIPEGVDEEGKVLGTFKATGLRPSFMEKFIINGVELPKNMVRLSAYMQKYWMMPMWILHVLVLAGRIALMNGLTWGRKDILLGIVLIILVILPLSHFIIKAWDAILAFMNTAYPGQRRDLGGGLDIS